MNDQELEVVNQTKLLGVICSSSGRWADHIRYLVQRANKRLYFIRRLKKLDASLSTLKKAYVIFVWPILEFCVPLWTGTSYLKTGGGGLPQFLPKNWLLAFEGVIFFITNVVHLFGLAYPENLSTFRKGWIFGWFEGGVPPLLPKNRVFP